MIELLRSNTVFMVSIDLSALSGKMCEYKKVVPIYTMYTLKGTTEPYDVMTELTLGAIR